MKKTIYSLSAIALLLVNSTRAQINPIVTTQVIGEYSQTYFGLTQQMAFDANGNLFINSQTNHSVYKITPSQNVSLFAGGGGSAGAVNGTGSVARFNNPAGICFMPTGDMLIADHNNSWMRYVSTGSVVTAATAFSVNTNGALSTNGVLNPNDVKYSATMNAYYVPSYSQNIVKYIAGGQIGVVPAGNVPNPTAVAIGTNNILYVAGSNGAIYRVAQPTPPGATFTLCAGSASATGYIDDVNPLNSRFSFIAGLAIRNDTLFIADGSNHAIRIMLPSGEVKTYIGGNGAGLVNGPISGAKINNPTGIAFNNLGQIFISDRGNGRVRIIGTAPAAPTTTNQTLCVAGSLDENFGKRLALHLAVLKKQKYKAAVMGMPTWDAIKDFTKPEYKGIEIIYSTPFYNPRTDKVSMSITDYFSTKMYARPSDMVMRGYETVWRFGKLLMQYKSDIASNLTRKEYNIFRELDIQPVLNKQSMTLDYFENKKLYFLKWQDGIIKSIN